ncbi:Cation-ATPase-N domain-containing protein [Mycena kentingensis (nom. inval.)]|nr:Cation-ATPase-N domain-containing protein [Mycena kentingensis (nom. inval.)]
MASEASPLPNEEENRSLTHFLGVELKHTLTQDEKDLAAAGYEHLEQKKKAEDDKTSVDITEHTIPLRELGSALSTSINVKDPGSSEGLTADEAAARLKRDGPNILTPPKKRSPLRQYIDRLLTMFNVLLIVAGVLEYALLGIDFHANFANTYLGAILIAVAFLNAFIDWYQTQKSEAILASFLAMIPPSCRVVREGESERFARLLLVTRLLAKRPTPREVPDASQSAAPPTKCSGTLG